MSSYPTFLFIPGLIAFLVFFPLLYTIEFVFGLQIPPSVVGQAYLLTFTLISLIWIYTPLTDMSMGINGHFPEPHWGFRREDAVTLLSLGIFVGGIVILFTFSELSQVIAT